MNHEVIVTCAVTGAGDTVGRHPAIPVTPKQIAAAAIEAAKAGATVAHCHVRDPQTGKPSRDVALYRELVERIRESDTDVIINLTAGMGGDLEIGRGEQPLEFGVGTDLVGPLTRLAHVEELLPEICTLDCGTLNFGDGDFIYVSTPAQLRAGAKRITELGVKAELEIFDTGHLWFAKQLVEEGLIEDPVLIQLCMGIPWGAPDDLKFFSCMTLFSEAAPQELVFRLALQAFFNGSKDPETLRLCGLTTRRPGTERKSTFRIICAPWLKVVNRNCSSNTNTPADRLESTLSR